MSSIRRRICLRDSVALARLPYGAVEMLADFEAEAGEGADHFRGPIADLVVLKHMGGRTQGLVGRNLLLGWMMQGRHIYATSGD